MKRQYFIQVVFCCLSVLIIQSCKDNPDNDFLKKVSANIDQIKSATYFSTVSGSAPEDTSKFNTYNWYKKEYFNPADTFIGSSFAWFQPLDTSKMYYFYDGQAQGYINNNLNYKFLISNEEVSNDYQVRGVPAFYILDEKRVIRRIIQGYEKGTTDKEIREIINKMI